jgi:hypothetical protein
VHRDHDRAGVLAAAVAEAAIWSSGFIAAMAASYLQTSANLLDNAWLDALSDGLMLLALGLVWVGLRARRGRRPILLSAVIGVTLVVIVTVALTSGTAAEDAVGNVELVVFAAISAATAIELVGVRTAARGVIIPLALSSGLVAVFSWCGSAPTSWATACAWSTPPSDGRLHPGGRGHHARDRLDHAAAARPGREPDLGDGDGRRLPGHRT